MIRAASLRFSVHTSDERFPVSGRIANGPAGRKCSFGAAAMVALMADGDDDAGLIIVPAMGGDACAFAQSRARAVGGDQQRLAATTVPSASVTSTPSLRESKDETAVARKSTPFSLGARGQRIDQMAVFDHMREGLAGLDIAGKRQKHRTGGVVEPESVTTMSSDRLRAWRDLIPDAERLEQPPAGGDDRGRARIAAWPSAPAPDRPP